VARISSSNYTFPWAQSTGGYNAYQSQVSGAGTGTLDTTSSLAPKDINNAYSSLSVPTFTATQRDWTAPADTYTSYINNKVGDWGSQYTSLINNALNSKGTATAGGIGGNGSNLYKGSAYSSKLIIGNGSKYVGTPYKWGGTNPKSGLDCSGFTQLVSRESGVSIPRTAATQYAWFKAKGYTVSAKNAQAGDLIYYRSSHGWHTGIYLGNGKMLDSPHTGSTVGVHNVWSSGIVGFGRLPIADRAATTRSAHQTTR